MNKTTLGNRMKDYEGAYDYKIISRVPIVMRLDGRSFSNMTKKLKFKKPFDGKFLEHMVSAAISVANSVQGCMVGYTQSDEITFVIRTDQSLDTTPWFDNRIQKVVSVASSLATVGFNKSLWESGVNHNATFDCRICAVANLDEAIRNLTWRQNDCVKNSISTAAYYLIGEKLGRGTTQKKLMNLNQNQRQELLFQETGTNWNDIEPEFKRGVVLYRKEMEIETPNGKVIRKKWIAEAAPTFNSELGRPWIENIIKEEKDGVEE